METEHGFFREQLEWLKGFFDEDEKATYHDEYGHNPSHKNLIGIGVILVFSVAFLKKVAIAPEVPDIPPGWQLVILGVLGIRALQSGATALLKSKTGNGQYPNSQPNQPPQP